MNSLRSRACSRCSTASDSPLNAPDQKTFPMTAASWQELFLLGRARASSRAAMMPCTVSGNGRSSVESARRACARIPPHTADSRPPGEGGRAACRPGATERSRRLSEQPGGVFVRKGSERDGRGVQLAAAPTRARSRSSGRAVATERATERPCSTRRGGRRSRGGSSSAQWRSSKASTSGRSLGKPFEQAPPGRERLGRRSPASSAFAGEPDERAAGVAPPSPHHRRAAFSRATSTTFLARPPTGTIGLERHPPAP